MYNQLIAVYAEYLPKKMLEKMQKLEKMADKVGRLAAENSAIKTPYYYFSKISITYLFENTTIYFVSLSIWK